MKKEEKLKEVVLKRLEIIKFFEKYGVQAKKCLLGLRRATVYLWKKKFKESGGEIESLIPKSRAPIRRKQKDWHPEIIEFIKRKRWEYPRIGQDALKVLLDEFCKEKGIKSLSASTIARIIRYLKDKNEIPNPKAKISFYAKTGKVIVREKKKKKKLRRGNYTPFSPGDLVQIDSISIFFRWNKKIYFLCN